MWAQFVWFIGSLFVGKMQFYGSSGPCLLGKNAQTSSGPLQKELLLGAKVVEICLLPRWSKYPKLKGS